MILVVGGIASGKRTYVRGLGYADDCMLDAREVVGSVTASGMESLTATQALTALFENTPPDSSVLLHAEELCHVSLAAADVDQLADRLTQFDVITVTEVGCGVVPLDASERAFREQAGRLSAKLADRATTVVRMVCGIPTALKSE